MAVWRYHAREIDKQKVINLIESDGAHRFSFTDEHHQNCLRRQPTQQGQVGNFSLPFGDSVGKIFEADTPLELYQGESNCYRYVEDDEEYRIIEDWIARQGTRVFIRDLLACSIALDFNRADPKALYSQVGDAEARAKRNQDTDAINYLVDMMRDFIESTPLYRDADYICAVPAHPTKTFDLPRMLANHLSRSLDKADVTSKFRFANPKSNNIKTATLKDKWDIWDGCGLSFDFDVVTCSPETSPF